MREFRKERAFSLVIVIPCFNESNRLQSNTYTTFIQRNENVAIIFSNDGSTDDSISLLQNIKSKANDHIFILNAKNNRGKASAVRSGFLFASKFLQYDKISYLDADLSTSLDECLALSKIISPQISFVFGSRISKIDNVIDRRLLRFIIGRIVATLISRQLGLTVYDTQCGCKIFRADVVEHLFNERFFSRWLFDVEIFHRLIRLSGKNSIKHTVREVPLKSWIDTENSKVQLSYFFRLWIDLYRISKKYKKKGKVIWKPLPQNTF